MEDARAILLRRYRFSENSLVVIWLTDRHGKVKTAVRSATRPGSPFFGRLELFTEAEIAFKAPKKGDLHSLSEVEVSPLAMLPATYVTILAASYFAELCDLFTEPMHPVPEIFSLLQRAWGFLRLQEPSRRAVEHFEGELAGVLGIRDPGVPGVRSLSSVAHKLPDNRERLLELLSREQPATRHDP
jgi:DNA repair protein RecO (recombination protein O)